MPVGTVKFFNADKGYGFIAPDGGGDDSFVHISAVQAAGMHSLDKEQRVNYEVEIGRKIDQEYRRPQRCGLLLYAISFQSLRRSCKRRSPLRRSGPV